MDQISIIVVVRSFLVVILIFLLWKWRRAINAVNDLTIKNKNLTSENEDIALIIHFLRELGGDTNSMYLDTEVINKLSLRTIKLFFINLQMYNLHRVKEFNGRMLGQYLQGYFTEIEDKEKRNYFYSVLNNALISQPADKLINLFFDDLKDEIINLAVENKKNRSVETRKAFRNWFLEILTRGENFGGKGRQVLAGITAKITILIRTENLSSVKEEIFYYWYKKLFSLQNIQEKEAKNEQREK